MLISPACWAKRVLRRPVPLKKGVRYSSSLPVITAQGPQSPNAVYVEAEEEEEEVEEEEEEEKEEEDRFGGNVIISNRIDNSNTGSSNKFDDKNVEDSNIKNDDDDDDNSNANIATTTTTNNNNNVNKEDNGRKNSVVERMPADPKAIGEDLTWLPPNPTDCTLPSALPLPVCCTLYMTQLPLYLSTLFMMQCRTLFMMQ